MKAQLIDTANKIDDDYFIYQEGDEKNKLSGPVILENLEQGEEFANLCIGQDGKIRRSLKALPPVILPAPIVVAPPKPKNPDIAIAENVDSLPQFSGNNVGRMIFLKRDENVYIDVGYKFKRISSQKIQMDLLVHETGIPLHIDISDSDIDDARTCLWQLSDNQHDFERLNCKIKTPDAKTLLIDLPAGAQVGTYRLLGLE